jgi:hypothetical protein
VNHVTILPQESSTVKLVRQGNCYAKIDLKPKQDEEIITFVCSFTHVGKHADACSVDGPSSH